MLVVTLPSSAAKHPLAYAKKAKAAGAHVLEIRGDTTPDVAAFDSPLPLLLSPRGNNSILRTFPNIAYVDLEFGEEINLPRNAALIRSAHDYKGTPDLAELKKIAADLQESKPAILKIATTINSYKDLEALDALHRALPAKQKRIILGMGPKAHLSRMLSPLRNALTYTYLEDGDEAAPGQVPLSLYALTKHCKKPLLMGITGGAHISTSSLSPLIHNTLMHADGIDGIFSLFPTDDFDDAWNNFINLGVTRFSVTAPWKKDVIAKLDTLDLLAEKLGSVNTAVAATKNATQWTGYNTDMIGFRDAYKVLKGACTIAICGSGGVVPAVIHACRTLSDGTITLYARNKVEREAIAKRFTIESKPLPSTSLPEYEAVIWTISTDLPITLPKTTKRGIAIDLRYGKPTGFLTEAKAKGYETHDGLAMLMLQAFKQFEYFTGKAPSQKAIDAVAVALSPYFMTD